MSRFRRHAHRDAGQAFPIYLTVVGGLLFLAFAYFAVGQAAANRNDAQTAADAAALAAAQERRDQLTGAWITSLLDPDRWQAIFDGDAEGLDLSCWRADQLAALNDAEVRDCHLDGLLRYEVEVQMTTSVGESIVPGTENRRSHASAAAVIEPRCGFEPPVEDGGGDGEGDGEGEGDAEEVVLPTLDCDGGVTWHLDPDTPRDLLPGPEDLFDVHLAE